MIEYSGVVYIIHILLKMENIRIFFVLPEKYSKESQASNTMLETFDVSFINLYFNYLK